MVSFFLGFGIGGFKSRSWELCWTGNRGVSERIVPPTQKSDGD